MATYAFFNNQGTDVLISNDLLDHASAVQSLDNNFLKHDSTTAQIFWPAGEVPTVPDSTVTTSPRLFKATDAREFKATDLRSFKA